MKSHNYLGIISKQYSLSECEEAEFRDQSSNRNADFFNNGTCSGRGWQPMADDEFRAESLAGVRATLGTAGFRSVRRLRRVIMSPFESRFSRWCARGGPGADNLGGMAVLIGWPQTEL